MKNKKIWITFGIVFILMLVINYFTIWAADDYTFYNLSWLGVKKFSFSNIIQKSNNFYMWWTGRYVSTFINYFFLYFNKSIFNICNSAMFVILIVYLQKIINIFINIKNKNSAKVIIFLLIFMTVWLLVPSFAQVMTWQIGSIIYLWTFVFAEVIFYYLILNQIEFKKVNVLKYILLIILSLLAGNGFETTGLTLLAFESLLLLYNFTINRKQIKKNQLFFLIIIFVFTLIGFCFNFFSPGNDARMTSMTLGTTFLEKILNGFVCVVYNGIIKSKIYFIIIAIFSLIGLFYAKNKERIKSIACFVFASLLLVAGIYINGKSFSELLIFYSEFQKPILIFAFIEICMFIYIIINVTIKLLKQKNKLIKNESIVVFSIFLSSIFGIVVYVFTPLAWPRSYMCMSILLILIFFVLLINFVVKYEISKKYIIVFSTIVFSIFLYSYCYAIIDTYDAYLWQKNTTNLINKQKSNKDTIIVNLYQTNNEHNAASVEKWVIPPTIENNENDILTENRIHKDYEWINIAITNYYYNDSNAWNSGKRIVAKKIEEFSK